MNYIISAAIGYLLGSIPTAYLIFKKKQNEDITLKGTGNVGAHNIYEITNSKMLGIIVMIIDMAKGSLSALIPLFIFGDVFIYPAIASIFAIFAHCFNPTIKFKGGRGLATTAGVTIIIFPYLLVIWVILWLLFYMIKKDISLGNISATIFTGIIFLTTTDIAIKYAYPMPSSKSALVLFVISILLLIFIKHIEPLNEIIGKKSIFRIKKK
jgi:acyl phosphate:glycerol-3-phosphate acyltransferase